MARISLLVPMLVLAAALAVESQQQQQQAPAWACAEVLTPGKPTRTSCADAKACAPRQAQIGGPGADVLVLSVGSVMSDGGFVAAGSDPGDCCARCAATDRCNAWAFCNDRQQGCGVTNACREYERTQLPANYSARGVTLATPLPIKGFGARGPGCWGGNGKWPFATCTLMRLQDASKPPPVLGEGQRAYGWVSGVVPKPAVPGCPQGGGWTNATCATCLATRAPAKCFACMQAAQLLSAGQGAANCAACAQLSSDAALDTCVGCVKQFPSLSNGCSSCLQFRGASGSDVDVAASEQCFKAVAAAGPSKRASAAFGNCFLSGAPGDVDVPACLKCSADGAVPAAAAAACASCTQRAVTDRAGCMTCLKQFGGGNGGGGTAAADQAAACGGCASLAAADAPLRQQCYGCVRRAGPAGASYCSMMGGEPGAPTPSSVRELLPQYYDCLAAVSRWPEAASSCFLCVSAPQAAADARGCLACVSKLGGKPWGHGVCAPCYLDAAQPAQCEACLARANSFDDAHACVQQRR